MFDKEQFEIEVSSRNNVPPKVSIGMPVYNGAKYIRRALDSLLEQTFADVELIISDNASTDATREICLEYAAKYQRIRYYRNDVNISAISNFNRVLDFASGQYFMWAAHDDVWDSSFISVLTQVLDDSPQTVLAFCRFVNIDDQGIVTQKFKTDWANVFSRSKFWQFAFLTLTDELATQKANYIYGLIRKDALVDCGGMVVLPDVDYSGEDILTLLCLLARWDFTIVERVLFYYRARKHTTRKNEPLAGYLWQRITRKKPGHQGSLVLFFIRNHTYHSNVRRIIINKTSLRLVEKLILWIAVAFKEIWFPISFLPFAVLRELQILR